LHYPAIYEAITAEILVFYYGVIWGRRPANENFSIRQIA
jgi:hypothetical protein